MSERAGWNSRVIATLAAIGALYFAEGFPYGVVTELLPVYMRSQGVSLAEIALLSTVSLAWTLKFFWAPMVDRVGTYRIWIRGALLGIAASIVLLGQISLDSMGTFWILTSLICVLSATQDIAIDALSIDRSSPETVGLINSMRITTYRIAIIAAGGGIALIADARGWHLAFLCAGAISAASILPTFFIRESPHGSKEESILSGLRDWLARPQAPTIIAIALLYKVGDSALAPMLKPFWVDSGFSVGEIGTATTIIGISFTILGGIVGGIYITKFGVLRSLLFLGILQMASNAGYVVAAATGASRPFMYSAAIFESFAGGLGTAAFLSFLMTVCEKRRAATQFALLSALYGLSRALSGLISGRGVELLHYGPYFALTLALGIPGLIVVYMNRRWIEQADAAEPPLSGA